MAIQPSPHRLPTRLVIRAVPFPPTIPRKRIPKIPSALATTPIPSATGPIAPGQERTTIAFYSVITTADKVCDSIAKIVKRPFVPLVLTLDIETIS